MGEWKGVSRTTVKWLRCYHDYSNEGSQDTLGAQRRRGSGKGGGGRNESDGEEYRGGGKIEKWREGKCKRPAGLFSRLCWHTLCHNAVTEINWLTSDITQLLQLLIYKSPCNFQQTLLQPIWVWIQDVHRREKKVIINMYVKVIRNPNLTSFCHK